MKNRANFATCFNDIKFVAIFVYMKMEDYYLSKTPQSTIKRTSFWLKRICIPCGLNQCQWETKAAGRETWRHRIYQATFLTKSSGRKRAEVKDHFCMAAKAFISNIVGKAFLFYIDLIKLFRAHNKCGKLSQIFIFKAKL